MRVMVDDVFPLPLTAFERFMLTDDRRDYPMTFVTSYEFSGQIDRQAWEQAYHQALDRHPLLNASLNRGQEWVAASHRRPIVWVEESTRLLDETDEFLDLKAGPGLRVWMQPRGDRLRWITQFHHACCDGIGAMQFQGDWLACYHAIVRQQPPELLTLDPMLLKSRQRPRWKVPSGVTVTFWQAIRSQVSEFYKFYRKQTQPISRTKSSLPQAFPGIEYVVFSKEQTDRLINAAEAHGVQLNDLLLRDLFVTLQQWSQLKPAGRKCWSVNMPTSLRDRTDLRMPCANVIGYTFLDAKPDDCEQPAELLRSLSRQTAEIRRWNLGQLSLDGLIAMSKFPFCLRLMSSPRKCHASVVLSNLGDPTRRFYKKHPRQNGKLVYGDLTLEHFFGIPPLRPLTQVVILLSFCHGQLTISLRTDSRWFRPEESSQLLSRFQENVLRSLESQSDVAEVLEV